MIRHSTHPTISGGGRWTWFLLWVTALLAMWTAAWVLYQAAFPWRGWVLGPWASTLYWTIAKVAVWIVPAVWILRREGDGLATTGLGSTVGLGRGLLVASAWLGALVVSSMLRGVWPSPPQSSALPALLNACLIAPIFEEFVFRGFALRWLRRGQRQRPKNVRFWPAAVSTSIAFGLLHVPGWLFMGSAASTALLAALGPVVVLGIVLAAVSWQIPSLWACIAIHLVNNAWDQGLILAVLSLVAPIAKP